MRFRERQLPSDARSLEPRRVSRGGHLPAVSPTPAAPVRTRMLEEVYLARVVLEQDR